MAGSTRLVWRGRRAVVLAAFAGIAAAPAATHAQTPLTLAEAMARARSATADARVLSAADAEAAERVTQARAGYFPRVDVTTGVQRGNQPVFVFSSLLSQRRFTAANFELQELNHPSAISNVRTALAVEQPVFDGGLTRLAVERAELNRELASAGRAGATQDLALRAARTFVRVLQLESAVRASEAAVEAAESDLARARNRRDVGLVTDADVLVVEVHLADVRQRQIAATADVAVARIELNEAIGAPLDAVAVIARPSPRPADQSPEALVREALTSRPEVRSAELASRLADTERKTARAAYLPRVGAQAGWEMNGNSWTEQRSSWVVGAEVQINVFRGFGDASRMAEATHAVARAAAERERVNRRIEVDVRAALARLEAAHARELAGRAALAQAQESHRILRDRYESGLATITDVLRASEGTLDAEARTTAAEMDVILETLALERAVGRL